MQTIPYCKPFKMILRNLVPAVSIGDICTCTAPILADDSEVVVIGRSKLLVRDRKRVLARTREAGVLIRVHKV